MAAIIFVLVGAFGQEPSQAAVKQEAAQAQAQEPALSQLGPSPSTEPGQPVPVAKPPEPKAPVYKSSCGETEDYNQANLCEQWRATKAAVRSARWTKWQAIIGFLGLSAVLATLIYTAIGARAATKAAEAATASANAADRTLKKMEETAERQLRAYIHIKDMKMHNVNSDEWSPDIQVQFQNFGSTPAYDVKYIIALAWAAPDDTTEDRFALSPSKPMVPIGDMGPTQWITAHVSPDWPIWHKIRLGINDGKLLFYVFGKIEYLDAFNVEAPAATRKLRTTEFRNAVVVDKDGLKDPEPLGPCSTGNKAT